MRMPRVANSRRWLPEHLAGRGALAGGGRSLRGGSCRGRCRIRTRSIDDTGSVGRRCVPRGDRRQARVPVRQEIRRTPGTASESSAVSGADPSRRSPCDRTRERAVRRCTRQDDPTATRPPTDAIPLLWQAATGFKNALTMSPPPPPPPPPPPSREKEIEQLLDRYVAAFRARDHVAVAQLDPSRSADAWKRYFGNLKILEVALDDKKTSIDGDSATATFTRRLVATTIFGEKLTPRVPVTLNLRRSANVWSVASAKEGGSQNKGSGRFLRRT